MKNKRKTLDEAVKMAEEEMGGPLPPGLLRLAAGVERAAEGENDFGTILGEDKVSARAFLESLAERFIENGPAWPATGDETKDLTMTVIAKSIAIGYALALNDTGQ